MFDFALFEFSRQHCVAICSFLVPANLIATITTLTLVFMGQSVTKMSWSKGIASIFAIALFLHVSTWFTIGVITPVTFILFGFGSTCLIMNLVAVAYHREARLISAKLLSALT